MSEGSLVEAQGLMKEYPRGAGVARVVDGVSFSIARGETLGLVGESGSGKSTVARMLLRLVEPTSGSIRFDGEDVLTAGKGALRAMRRRMQIVFQDPYAALNPRKRVSQILAEPFAIHGERPEGGVEARVLGLLGEVGLEAAALRRYPHEFSGGQRQRINIARALALRPKFLVLDEPVSALDVSVGGSGDQPAEGVAEDAWVDLPVYLALDASGAVSVRPGGGDAGWAAGGDGGR